MLDVHNQLGILSKSYQSNSLVIFDISKNLNRTLRALEKLKKEESCGPDTRGLAESSYRRLSRPAEARGYPRGRRSQPA